MSWDRCTTTTHSCAIVVRQLHAIAIMTDKIRLQDSISRYWPQDYTLRRARRQDPENVQYLRDRLSEIFKSDDSPFKTHADFTRRVIEFAEAASHVDGLLSSPFKEVKIDDSRLSRFINGRESERQFNNDDFRTCVLYLDFLGILYKTHWADDIGDRFPDPLFHSLRNFMGVGEFTLNNMKRRAPGFYRAYRPASTFPGNFWVGCLEISIDPQSDAITTREFYQSGGFDGRPNKTVEFFGYIVRKGRHYTIISRNQSSSSLSAALLPSVTIEDHKITNMTGAVMDMSTGHLWAGRILYDRVELPALCVPSEAVPPASDTNDEAALREAFRASARVCGPDEISQSIVHHFRDDPIPNLRMY